MMFTYKNKHYRLVDHMLVLELQIKGKNGRYEHVGYLTSEEDARKLIGSRTPNSKQSQGSKDEQRKIKRAT